MATRKVDIPAPIHAWLLRLQTELKIERGRNVTIAETLEYVMTFYEAMRETRAGQDAP